jgi:hypothetical protein
MVKQAVGKSEAAKIKVHEYKNKSDNLEVAMI